MTQPPREAPSLSVLIVDDYPDAASSLAGLLGLAGHRATVATSGPAALAAAGREHPDVILLELRLPGMDGYAVARELRAKGCRARLIAVTTSGKPEDLRRAAHAGIQRYFIKPVAPAELLSALRDGPPRCPGRAEAAPC
jgi:CheY-like chemotaxis protein